MQSDTCIEWVVCSAAHSVSSLSLISLSLQLYCLQHPHLQNTALALYNIVHLSFLCVKLIEDLRRELEHLQLFKLETERPGRSRSSSSGLADFNSRTREVELEHEVKRLKQVLMKDCSNVFVLHSQLSEYYIH